MDCPENGIIFGTAMAEKRLEDGKMRYSAAYSTGAERCRRISMNMTTTYEKRSGGYDFRLVQIG